MKTTLFIVTLLCSASLFSQSCLPDGITFTSAQDISDFTSLNPTCTTIEGDVIIQGVTNFEGLEQITSIEGNIICDNCIGFQNFEGLNNLETLGGIEWIGGDEFEFAGLESLDVVTGSMSFFLADFNDFGELSSLSVQGDFMVEECTFNGFQYATLEEVGGTFLLRNNPNFFNTQLFSLESVGGEFILENNTYLTFAGGFSSLMQIGGNLRLVNNPELQGIIGIWNLENITGDLFIEQMPALDNLDFLENLTELNGAISLLDNASLNDITGIQNIDPESISALQIVLCPQLSECSVESICGFLQISPQFSQIAQNLTDCNSNDEVIQNCEIISVEESSSIDFSLVSNLVNHELSVRSKEQVSFSIYNSTGQLQGDYGMSSGTIDVSDWSPGVYFLCLKDSSALKFQKF